MTADIITAAQAKLQRIIDREGDADGIRRESEYLYLLIAEEEAQREFIKYTNQNHDIKKEGSRQLTGKRKACRDHNQPLQLYHRVI